MFGWLHSVWTWLNSNAGAIQGLSAAIVAMLTLLLFATTLWYTRLTRRIVEVTEKQLNASMYPVVEISLPNHTFSSKQPTLAAYLRIKNTGSSPFVISKVVVVAADAKGLIGQANVEDFEHLVLMPEMADEKLCKIDGNRTGENAFYSVLVDVSDLADVSKHSFLLGSEGRLKHFSGFDTDRIRAAVEKTMNLS